MIITTEDIIRWEPYTDYTEEAVEDITGDGKTPLEICELSIPVKDKLWILLRKEIIPEDDLHEFVCLFTEDVLMAERIAEREPHFDSWLAVQMKRAWLMNEASDKELSDAKVAAVDAISKAESKAGREAAGIASRAAMKQAEISAGIISLINEYEIEGISKIQERLLSRIKIYLEEKEETEK